MSTLERWQVGAKWVAIVAGALGFVTSAGCGFSGEIPGGLVYVLHLLLLVVGIVCGYLSVLRGEEIDRERWRVVEDPALTSGERAWAHKNAERSKRFASTAFVAAPLMLGYWLAYQVAGGGTRLVNALLPVSAVLGSVIGMILGRFFGVPRSR